LPYNLKFVSRSAHSFFTSNITPLSTSSIKDDEVLNAHLSMLECCKIVQKPVEFDFGLGIELIRRPVDHQFPSDVNLLPISEYPEGFEMYIDNNDDNLEVIRLSPRFDFPIGCKLSPSWIILPRPNEIRLPINVQIVYPVEEYLGNEHLVPPLPSTVCEVSMPEIPYNFRLPQYAVAVEILNLWNDFCLPEGAILAPGVTVINPFRFLHNKSNFQPSLVRGLPNALLVHRQTGCLLPDLVEKGCSNDMPMGIGSHLRLQEGMEFVRVAMRFELPAGNFSQNFQFQLINFHTHKKRCNFRYWSKIKPFYSTSSRYKTK
jgi:hypothetical protein